MASVAPLIVVVGPTASGKSAFAMELARRYDGELICADSRTVYKYLDIGTAKPSVREQKEIAHHLLDIREPNEPFSAAEFKVLANQAIEDIWSRGRLPIMVGGTGLYVDGVIFDYQFGALADPKKREQLTQLSVKELQDICREKNIILPVNHLNKRHLVRAIETGGLLQQHKQFRKNTIVVGLTTDRTTLLHRITMRAHAMIDQGIVAEVRLMSQRCGWDSEAMKGNIYRIFRGVIEGKKEISTALQEVIYSDIHLAKRQMTWFRRNRHIIWGSAKELKPTVGAFVEKLRRNNG